ncbi:MAG TPA: DUF1924 domain-containing protein [Bryobacterales bacterium]|nr:DUF1924 domain-containing protein [Bryobacterales bacterium]
MFGRTVIRGFVVATLFAGGAALAGSPQEMLKRYEAEAKAAGSFPKGGFSAERGRAFFLARHGGGKPATPSCTTCHTDSPLKPGKTRTGKVIQPMALSKTPDRYSDPEKVEKWFRRNCRSVLGRECTPVEKGDVITFMIGQ